MEHKEELQVNMVLDIFRISNLFSRMGGELTTTVGLTSIQQWMLLSSISKQEKVAIKELRGDTLVTKQNVSSMVDRLKQAGYVSTSADPTDRRITRVSLTAEGKKVIRELEPLTTAINNQIFEVFDVEELITFSSLLQRLTAQLTQKVKF
ncbi:MarR family winged helix-turn-helix transcriptional regulator [Paenibacillus dauci]|uniref:MarR family winged helix-turn-helix transcriptional regulator n=1 Tax=Paenibacillus dauci TaxID=1567106 RepID=UPI0006194E39|nr:MarR family winged helix-turn-helix transcriptional regulator [Paenibacillus dauci]